MILLPDTNIRDLGPHFKTMKNKQARLAPGFTRPDTYVRPYKFGYVIGGGGFGDYICYVRAFEWIADNLPHIYGHLYYPSGLIDFVKYFFDSRPHWKVEPSEPTRGQDWDPGFFFADPFRSGNMQFYGAHAAHPLDLGFRYYPNIDPTPESHNNYPEIDLVSDGLPEGLTPKGYVVFTPGSIAESRTVPGQFWNPILDHVKGLGLQPVVLGKTEVTKEYFARAAKDMDMDGVVNLWDQTTILQAAQIIQYSAATVGLDNGLLHLAGCTDAPIVFGYNVTTVEKRRPRRRPGRGKTVDVFLSPEELGCSGCLINVKAHYGHDFNSCMYKSVDRTPHPKCIEMLFSDGGARWKRAIDQALEW